MGTKAWGPRGKAWGPRGHSTFSATVFVSEMKSPFNGEYLAGEWSGIEMVCPHTSLPEVRVVGLDERLHGQGVGEGGHRTKEPRGHPYMLTK